MIDEQSDEPGPDRRLRDMQIRQIALSDEIELHCEQLDDDDKRLNQLQWIVVMFTIWLSVLTCLVVWGVMR